MFSRHIGNSCFGVQPWTAFEVAESNVGGPVVFQAKVDSGSWQTALPKRKIIGQNVWLRAKVAGTGGYVKVKVTGTCIG